MDPPHGIARDDRHRRLRQEAQFGRSLIPPGRLGDDGDRFATVLRSDAARPIDAGRYSATTVRAGAAARRSCTRVAITSPRQSTDPNAPISGRLV